jgi:hypothetical protein
MGNLPYLTGTNSPGRQSIDESLYGLENTSVLFCNAWSRGDLRRAARVSADAMEHLDRIVNEILRTWDTNMARGRYSATPLESQLNIVRGRMVSPVTSAQQQAMVAAGPRQLLGQPVPITLEKLLNKIKHHHHQSANFRIDNSRHVVVINVDKPNKTSDSIAEFDVLERFGHCRNVAQYLQTP